MFGTVEIYATSYLRNYDPDLTMNDTYLGIPSIVILSTAVMFVGPKLAKIIGYRSTVTFAMSLVVLTLLICSLTTNWIIFLCTFVIGCGTAVGTGYIPALTCGWAFWPWIKGRISGTILTFFGFGAFIFSIVGTWIVNPDNVKPDDKQVFGAAEYYYFRQDIASRTPYMYWIFFLVYLLLAVIAFLLIRYPDEDDLKEIKAKHERIDEERMQGLNAPLLSSSKATPCPSVKDGLTYYKFWLLFFMNLCSVSYGIFMAAVFKAFGMKEIQDD